mgnify:FL=1
MKISVIGAGTMGNGIAHVFAQNGFTVTLIDVNQKYLQEGLKKISENLDRQIKKGILSEKQKTETLSNIATSVNLKESVRDTDLVIEAVNEDKNLKFEIFKILDLNTPPDSILATNTSSISITEIAAQTSRPQKVIGLHFMNPVPVMQLVEVIKGIATNQATLDLVLEIVKKIGKTHVVVNDYPGFISNRILMPMINEAIYCVMEGVATPEAIDTVMKLGMNHPMGPLTLADFIGLDVCLSIMNILYDGFGDPKYSPCPLLKKMVSAGYLGRKTGKGFFNYK